MATSAGSGSLNPPRSLFALAPWKMVLIAESAALGTAVSIGLGEIGLSAVSWLTIAVVMLGVQVISPVLAAETRTRWYSWIPVGSFAVATALFIASIDHRPHIAVPASHTRVPQPSATIQSPRPPAVVPPTATGIDGSWNKLAPKAATFSMSDGRKCGPDGDGEDTLTNIRKNRVDVPDSYHDVTWADIAHVYFPRDKVVPKSLVRWSADEIVKIMQFQDIPVRAEGYIKKLRPQAGNKESTNCNATKAADTDWHIAFVEHAVDPELSSIVTEVTPRIKIMHPAWTQKNLRPWIDSNLPVRFSGWLLFDPEHKNHLGRYRQTLWEIHPITKIEVQLPGGAWVDLDRIKTNPDPWRDAKQKKGRSE